LPKFDPEISIYDNWKQADPLNSAWFHFAPDGLKNQYRDSGDNEHKAAALRYMMESEVRHSVGNKELIALGIQTTPSLEMEPEHIPAMMFASETVQIDWEESTIEGLGRRFAEVRICQPIPENLEIVVSVADRATKRGGGRNDIYPLARIILAKLH
jgi:hypothetical protein